MPGLKPARHRIQIAWVAILLLSLVFVSCWKVEADLVVSTDDIDFKTTKVTNPITIKNDSKDNSLTSGVETLEYKLKCDKAWMSVTPSTGSCEGMQTHSHTVSVDRSLMTFGENLGTISITSNGGNTTIKVRAVRLVPGCDLGPTAPLLEYPPVAADDIGSNVELAWSEGDSRCDQLRATYDVYFGTATPPPFDHDNDTLKVWNAGALEPNTIYYWRVVVKDANGEVRGPQWSFRTACTAGPNGVTLLTPADNATGLPVDQGVTWKGGTSQCPGLTSSYDVYFGATSPPPLRANTTLKYYAPVNLAYNTTYYWKIVAKDAHGTVSSEERSFKTAAAGCGFPPSDVILVEPDLGEKDVGLNQDLVWTGGESRCEGLTATYDVYFGTASPPPFDHNNGTSQHWDPGTLQYDTIYYWKITAKDANGTRSNNGWFQTPCHLAPSAITNVAPPDGATGAGLGTQIKWGGGNSDCPGTSSTYDVYFGITANPPRVQSGVTVKYYDPGLLLNGLTYYWKIIAKNENGQTSSPVWSFRTEFLACSLPPSAPCNPTPSNNATNRNRDSDLSWTCGLSQCADQVTYDVYFGETSNLGDAQKLGSTDKRSWTLPRLSSSKKYYWKVIAKDENGATPGPLWSFTTKE